MGPDQYPRINFAYVMKIEIFSSIEELKADRIARQYSKEELIAQKNAARAIHRIRIDNANSQRES